MTQAEKLKAVLSDRGMDEIALARRMRISPGFMIAVTRGWAVLDAWHQAWAENLLGLEPGTLKDEGAERGKIQCLKTQTEVSTRTCSALSTKEPSTGREYVVRAPVKARWFAFGLRGRQASAGTWKPIAMENNANDAESTDAQKKNIWRKTMDKLREKVIRGLKACALGYVCGENCPYERPIDEDTAETCIAEMARDALKVIEGGETHGLDE